MKISEHPKLDSALQRFPDGPDSIQAENARNAPLNNSPNIPRNSWFRVGDPDEFSFHDALEEGSETGDFTVAMQIALERWALDTGLPDKNTAPKEFWRASARYRRIAIRAGRKVGAGAAQFPDEVPDEEIRLLAQIEFAAGLAQLPELEGVQVWRDASRRRRAAPQNQETPLG